MKMQVRRANESDIKEAENWGFWSKEPSEFPWEYDERESCLILEGHAEVSDNDGNKIVFRAGDLVTFEKGLQCRWHILETIKKKFLFG